MAQRTADPLAHEFDAGSFAGAPEPRIARGQGNPVSGRQREIGRVVGGQIELASELGRLAQRHVQRDLPLDN
jgi:hypothetical protein